MTRGLLFGIVLLLAGCGYSTGYRLPKGVTKIAVPTFVNETFPLRRDLEFDVTREVRRQLQVTTDAKIVAVDRADGILEGTVVSFRESVLTEGAGDSVQDASVLLVVKFRFVRRRDGKVLLERQVSDSASFSVAAGETVEDARREAVNEVSERIVAELEPWG